MELPELPNIVALRIMLCGEVLNSVDYCSKDFKTYGDIRAVVMKWAFTRNIENEGASDPMDCNQALSQDCQDPWGEQKG